AITRFAHAVDAALDRVADASATFMRPEEKTDAIAILARVENRITALKLQVMAVADDACEDRAYRTVTDLVSQVTREDRGRVAAEYGLALGFERFQVLAAAMAAGLVSVSKARVIVDELTVLDLDPDVPREVVERAEQHLVSQAPDFTTLEIRRMARKVLETVAPWIEEDRERKRLEAEERRAQQRLSLKFHHAPDGLEGVTEIRARIPTALAGRLRTYLEAFTAPRHLTNATTNATRAGGDSGLGSAWSDSALGEHVPYHQRLAAAFCTMLETIDPDQLPIHGGAATTVMVTMTLESLISGLDVVDQTAGSHGEVRITAAQARRLACNANIIPVVLGGKSEILDLGRTSRLFTTAQRKAMALRDKTCRAEDCTVPAAWCEAHHHQQPWSKGGKTNLDDGKLLCSWHHHRAHDTRYLVNELPNGDIRYSRRT
ncbi:MAG TPA: hypothetical protein VN108_06875, partial [Marmoricola sp.]|nr:hypothetical protein [Marmoricola sp.]